MRTKNEYKYRYGRILFSLCPFTIDGEWWGFGDGENKIPSSVDFIFTITQPLFTIDQLEIRFWLDKDYKHILFQLLKTTAIWQVKYISWKNKDSIQGL